MAMHGRKLDPKASDKTAFVCQSDWAQSVFLAGSFNDWDPSRTQMDSEGEGAWRVELELAPGRYEYKFIVDGAWCCEPGRADSECANCVPNSLGTMNRVVEIPGTAEARAATSA